MHSLNRRCFTGFGWNAPLYKLTAGGLPLIARLGYPPGPATGLARPPDRPGRPAWPPARPGYPPSPARVLEKLVTPFFSVTKYSQLPAAGCSAASIAALPGLSIGPGGSPLCR